jgi:PHD/YefM family antitoxin component YafN of YafNO toxin-antitoxin module
MTSIQVSKARIGDIFDSVVESRQPVRLTSRNSSAIVVGWDQWQAIEQTLFRLSASALRPVRRVRRAEREPHARN